MGNLHCCPIFHQNFDKAHRQAGLYFSFIYLILIWEFAAAYAPMRTIETYRQAKPRGKERRKAARELTPTAQSDTDYANWTSVFNFIYGLSCGWCGRPRTPNRDIVVGF